LAVRERTDRLLAVSKERQAELVLFWSGVIEGTNILPRSVWLPVQSAGRYFFDVDPEALIELNHRLFGARELLLGQVQTHAAEAFHSAADDEFAVSTREGAFSIVAPDFGRYSVADTTHTVYFERRGRAWAELSPKEVQARILFEEP
jgi:hypothetical protein